MFLQINNLHKNFETKKGKLVVLKDINMSIKQGEFICAVGASGSGKSTLLRQIAGLDKPTTGEVKIDGKEAVFLSNRIYALGARPGTVRKEMSINLPDRTPSVKRHARFHDYRDELMDLMRKHGQEAVAMAA